MKSVPSSILFPDMEKKILEFWNEEDVFQKSLLKNKGNKPYIFYDGPPFATGMPHYGHILTSYIKDTVPRYFTMRGRFVDRRWGWDCHGLPVEYEIEKKLNISGKKDIEAFGIDKFNEACRDIVMTYADDWQDVIDRIGRWVDFDRQYRTMDRNYMESVMWIFKTLYDKGLVYESLKVVPYCNRCQTPLSNFETGLDDSYRVKEDPSVTVAFMDELENDLFYLAWTTTPWTLPSNLALAVNPELEYLFVKSEERRFVLLKDRLPAYEKKFSKDFSVLKTVSGKDLVGKRYVPLFDFALKKGVKGNPFRILPGDFIETGTGTGIVHTAPAFGEEDFFLSKKEGIEPFNTLGPDGLFNDDAGFLTGKNLSDGGDEALAFLKEKGLLFSKENIHHSYPHCWRCDTPLIYRTISSWYVKVTDFKDKMCRENKNINWVPDHIKEGRFGQWLEGARDWAISRNRFWGSPVPVWKCDICSSKFVPGSINELEDISGQKIEDLHRPYCDGISFKCQDDNCNGTMTRIEEVLDCWFESGAMPYAQEHFPFENKEHFEANSPASFIVEYVAQTRGWFYTLMVESAAIMEKHPFENAICHGVILADDGRKMSKSLKNFPDPMKVVDEYGSDALRIYLLSSAVVRGADIRFSENGVRDAARRYLIPLWNSFHFFSSYASILEGYTPTLLKDDDEIKNLQDRHILSELMMLKCDLEKWIEAYDLPRCYLRILSFVELLSGWYIRNNRERFWVTDLDSTEDSREAFDNLYTVLTVFSKVAAPFLPFTAETIHLHLTDKSVHLEDWPVTKDRWLNPELNSEMDSVRKIIEGGRRIREKQQISLRQPLSTLRVAGAKKEIIEQFSDLLKQQLNIKEIFSEDAHTFSVVTVIPDIKKLGPVLKGDLKKVLSLINSGEYELKPDRSVLCDGKVISSSEYRLDYNPVNKNEDVWSDGNIVLALSLEVTEELKKEGVARNMNRYIQDLRKKMGLAYDERILLNIESEGFYSEALKVHKEWLLEQCLAELSEGIVSEAGFEIKDDDGEFKVSIISLK